MSPEPIQPHTTDDQTWQTTSIPSVDITIDNPNNQLQQTINHSNEHIQATGYLPLSQDPTDSDSNSDDTHGDEDEDDDHDQDDDDDYIGENTNYEHEWTLSTIARGEPSSTLSAPLSFEPITLDNSEIRRPSIHLDAEKISQVKSIMANFELPIDSHPPWANVISEDNWKKKLMDEIKKTHD